jgi:hypothetical protein
MKALIILALFCGSLYGADTNNLSSSATNSSPAPKLLVEVIFAGDDMAPTQTFHTVVSLSISGNNYRGEYQSIYNWAVHGGGSTDTNTLKENAECLKLLRPLDQPTELPETPNHIVTVRCLDGDNMLVKMFPIDRVPDEVHQMLAIMGFRDDQFSRLTFIQRPGQLPFTNYNASIIFDGR